MTAREIRVFRNLSSKLIKIEERGRLLGILIERGVGLKEEELRDKDCLTAGTDGDLLDRV